MSTEGITKTMHTTTKSPTLHPRLSSAIGRRAFIHRVAAGGAAAALLPRGVVSAAPAERVNLACCGIGHRGLDDVRSLHATGQANIVALCDTDIGAPHTRAVLEMFPDVPRFTDFRKMFDALGRSIDAVSVAVPDFSHFPIAMLAMAQGKHVYCEKPMAHSFRQISLMMAAEKKYNVAGQMGNQGHSQANYFQFKAWVEAGIIRNVTRITAFMNSPRRWHGMDVSGYLPKQPLPETLDWDSWLSSAAFHDYNVGYVNGDWRSWFDFGNGALGDWGAHLIDTAHEFLSLGLPTEIDPVMLEGHNRFIFPQASTLAFRFPARGPLPPVELTWYDGQQNLPPLPEGMGDDDEEDNKDLPPAPENKPAKKKSKPGKVIYGEGLTFTGGSHGRTLRIIPQEKGDEMAASLPEVPESPSDHYLNFLRACRGEEKCRSSFAVAGPLCQTMALGVIAQRVNAKLAFDPVTGQITNHKEANEFLAGVPPRPGWEEFYNL
jgi:predicted dehydrogenase